MKANITDIEKQKMFLKALFELGQEAENDDLDKYEDKKEPVVVAGSTINQVMEFIPPDFKTNT